MSTDGKFTGDNILNTFYIESRENLEELENSLIEIEKGEQSSELIDSIFRSMHTIKGSSGMFGVAPIEKFTHVVENLLDNVRKGLIKINSELVSLLLDCKDHVENLLDAAEDRGEMKELGDNAENDGMLTVRLNEYLKQDAAELENNNNKNVKKSETSDEKKQGDSKSIGNKWWHISLRFGKDVFRFGLDPFSFISYLNKVGKIKKTITITDALPSLDKLDPESCYLGFEIDFDGDVSKEKIEEIFEFIQDDCLIKILPPNSSIDDYMEHIEDLPETNILIGEILHNIGTLTGAELEHVLHLQKEIKEETKSDTVKPIGEIIVDEKIAHKSVIDAALEKQNSIRKKHNSMRIDPEKLDSLINLVGELVITGANIKQISESDSIDMSILNQSVGTMTRLIEDIRDSTMSIRMVQIGETFKRFERIVRDLSRERNKKVNLIVSGGDTEMDKTLIEKISDPLMHLVRNAVDHGIDAPKNRKKQGKPEVGSIYLDASHEAGNIVIEIRDDGNGLNREKIFNKAVEKGLIEAQQSISDHDLYQYIFDAGFSTAEKVTNISGRGVGMDVVQKNIESMRGTVILDSEDGVGTTIKIHLPLTLSIIDGFMFQVGGTYYVVPLDQVIECTEASREELSAKDGGNYINLRGEVLPFMKLREFFKEEGDEPELSSIIVIRHRGGIAGLVVDSLMGELQTVIKPLGDIFRNVKWISGSTILGSGEVVIILDTPNLFEGIRDAVWTEADSEKEVTGSTNSSQT